MLKIYPYTFSTNSTKGPRVATLFGLNWMFGCLWFVLPHIYPRFITVAACISCRLKIIPHSNQYVGTYMYLYTVVLTWITTNARCCLFVEWLYPQPQYVVLKSTGNDLYPVIFRWYPHFVLVIFFPSDWCNSWFRKVYLQSYIVGWLLFEVNKMQLYPCSYCT